MAFGDEGIAVGCDHHRCRVSNNSRPCRLGLPCPASAISTSVSGQSSPPAYLCRTRLGQRPPRHCRFYRVRPDGGKSQDAGSSRNDHAGAEIFHRLAVGGQFPRLGRRSIRRSLCPHSDRTPKHGLLEGHTRCSWAPRTRHVSPCIHPKGLGASFTQGAVCARGVAINPVAA